METGALQRALRREWVNQHREARDEIIRKYARLYPSGKTMLCQRSMKEEALGVTRLVGKIIFDTEEAALACAEELRGLYDGEGPKYTYECHRSKRGHVHLTSMKQRRRS